MNSIQTRHGRWMPEEFEKGLVSAIIPTYNRANILLDALDSVWAQTYRPIELIVVDDGSNDDTDSVVQAWRFAHQGDERFEIHYFYQENSGAPSARNLGLIESKGEYIQFLDSDDILYPDMMTQVVSAFREMGSDFINVGYDKICVECGRTIYRYVPELERDAIIAYLYGKLSGHTTSLTRRRSLAQVIGPWDVSLIIDQDGDYMVRTILNSHMGVIRKKLFAYRVQSGVKINDRKGSHEAWQCRLQRETRFCEGIQTKADLPAEARGAYAQRLYERALSLYNEGLTEIGEAFGALADGVEGAVFTRRGKWIQRSWRGGRRVYAVYQWARGTRNRARKSWRRRGSKTPACPVCGG